MNKKPTLEQLERELARRRHDRLYLQMVNSTTRILLVVVALAVIAANYFFSLVRVDGTSMAPTVEQGELLLTQRTSKFEQGDIIAFYYNNKLLLKRVIAGPGDWVDIDGSGSVSVNQEPLSEPYILDPSQGDGDVEYPHQVSESHWFVLGDHRSTSMDSRFTEVGEVAEEQVYGKALIRVWPLGRMRLGT